MVAYSYGTLVAFEIIRRFEALGMNGQILFIDGSPNFLKQLMCSLFNTNVVTDEQLQTVVITATTKTIFPELNIKDIVPYYKPYTKWSEKLSAIIELTRNAKLSLNEENLKTTITGFYHRCLAIHLYSENPTQKIKSNITLVRPNDATIPNIDNDDYGLSQYAEGSFNLTFMDGNHHTILDNEKIINLINSLNV